MLCPRVTPTTVRVRRRIRDCFYTLIGAWSRISRRLPSSVYFRIVCGIGQDGEPVTLQGDGAVEGLPHQPAAGADVEAQHLPAALRPGVQVGRDQGARLRPGVDEHPAAAAVIAPDQ